MIFKTLRNTLLGRVDNENVPSKIKTIRTINILNTLFILMLIPDILIRFFTDELLLMYSSILLITFLFVARIFIYRHQEDLATKITASAFFVIALYHSIFIGNIIIPYFILLVTPLLCAVVLSNFKDKIIIFIAALVLFFICNHFAAASVFSNLIFIVALIPSFFGMLYFYDKLQFLEKNKHKLIQALEVKNQETVLFSQMMSHDLKAPLRSIKGFSSLLKRKLNTEEHSSEQEYLKFIMDSSGTMTTLIDDLLTYSKASTDKYEFKSINLSNFIEEQKILFRYEINEGLLVINTSNLGTIEGNINALQTVFQNLISNAIKYQPKDEKSHQAIIDIDYKEKETHHHITFQDNGIGIKKEYLEKLFLPFQRFHTVTEYEGTGLGLSICKKILNKHNGDISVSFTSEKGTCFLIEIAKDLN